MKTRNLKNKSMILSAALTGVLLATSGCATGDKSAQGQAAVGECHGVNACKGKGECGGKGHSCAGMNTCKGKAWVKMTEADCKAKKGKYKAI